MLKTVVITGFALLFTMIAAVSLMADSTATRAERLAASPNYIDGEFTNSEPTDRMAAGGTWDALKYYVGPTGDRRPVVDLPVDSVDVARFEYSSEFSLVWLGHATVLLRLDGTTILTDPVFDEHTPLLVGKSKRFCSVPMAREDLPKVDVVLISHDHFDHLEESSVRYFASSGTVFVVPLGVGMHLEAWDVPGSQIIELDWWEKTTVGAVRLVCTPARHFSGRSPFKLNATLWSSWVSIGQTQRLFYSGDTGYSKEFAEIGRRYGPFDLTLMQIGAYGDNWPDIHLTPDDAVRAHTVLNGRRLLPVHWGTFDLALHPWDEPIELLVEAAQREGVMLVTPRPGEVIDALNLDATDEWWTMSAQNKSD